MPLYAKRYRNLRSQEMLETPSRIEPVLFEDGVRWNADLRLEPQREAGNLAESSSRISCRACRPRPDEVNSYYSNLIEGLQHGPETSRRRSLGQSLIRERRPWHSSKAHVEVQRAIDGLLFAR